MYNRTQSASQSMPQRESVNRLEIATFWRAFHHDGKFSPAWRWWGCTPTPFHSIYPFDTSCIASSNPSPAIVARNFYLCAPPCPTLTFSLVNTLNYTEPIGQMDGPSVTNKHSQQLISIIGSGGNAIKELWMTKILLDYEERYCCHLPYRR
jgi:hypothetical protein